MIFHVGMCTCQVGTNCGENFHTHRAREYESLRGTVLAALGAGVQNVSAGVLQGRAVLLQRARSEAQAQAEKYKQAMLVIVHRSFCMDVTSYGILPQGAVPSQ